MFRQLVSRTTVSVASAALLSFATVAAAQSWDYVNPIPAGTSVQVRATEKIDTQSMDGRIYTGTVEKKCAMRRDALRFRPVQRPSSSFVADRTTNWSLTSTQSR